MPKINIHTPAGLDAFVDILAEDAPAIIADMGAGAGQVTHDWFHKMYPDVADAGVVFTAIGVVTSDPASVESVLDWAAALEDRVAYVIVENNLTEHTDFSCWRRARRPKNSGSVFSLRSYGSTTDWRIWKMPPATMGSRSDGWRAGRPLRPN